MHAQDMDVGDRHADFWRGLVIADRWVSRPHDITVGDHPALGRCTVMHYGMENRITWITERPIPEAA